jgi:outer membrane protein assembly factor BamB
MRLGGEQRAAWWRLRCLTGVAIAVAATAAAGCGGGNDDGDRTPTPTPRAGTPAQGSTDEAAADSSSWAYPNGDLGNSRRVGGPIAKDTVERLGVAWTSPITASGVFGGYAATPIITGGKAYVQDLASNVKALDLRTGKELWSKDYDSPNVGPNGVSVAEGRVYGATTTSAFALDQETGKELWSVKLTRNAKEGIDMAPGFQDGTVYVSTVPGNAKSFYAGNGVGILWALDAATGEKRWSFNTVPDDLWSEKHKDINSGGGLWHAPAFDAQGAMYFSVANPAPWPGTEKLPWGTSRPGPDKYTNTIVKLDAETGKMEWHNQVLPHDIYDWDLHLAAVLAEADGKPIVLSGGKMGYVYAFDPQSGKQLWKRAVGQHNGHDHDNELALRGQESKLKTPVKVLPGILGGVETQMAVNDTTVFAPVVNLATLFKSQTEPVFDVAQGKGEMDALDLATGEVKWKREFDHAVYGAATLVNDLVFTTTFDGTLYALDADTGDIVWDTKLQAGTNATVAVAGDTLLTAASFPQGKSQKAEIVAYRLDANGGGEQQVETPEPTEDGGGAEQASGKSVFTENCGSCHTLADAGTSGSVGPDLDELQPGEAEVARQVTDGGGGMPAFGGRLSDAEIAAVATYVSSVATGKAGEGGGGGGP